jgi:acyl carrier protein
MGQAKLTADDVAAAVLEAMRRVVPRNTELSLASRLDCTGLDSLALTEVMVHLEDLIGMVFDERKVRMAVLEPDYNPSMTVEQFAQLLLRLAHEVTPEVAS